MNPARPLDALTSIKAKLGLLVGVSVVVAVLVAAVGAAAEVPWWITVPVTVAAALAVTQWLARGMTSPLREMTGAARAMAAGDYSLSTMAFGDPGYYAFETTVTPVPEPETYGMFLAGLGMLGLIARRKLDAKA